MSATLNIIFCVETGVLEQQSKLLIASIKHWFVGINYQLYAYSPRADKLPSLETQDFFKRFQVNWCSEPINTAFHDYPIANKVLACQHFESHHPEQKRVMFLDTDTVFVNPIDQHLLDNEQRLYVRPVDNKGPGSESSTDPNDGFWQDVFALRGVVVPTVKIQTTVRPAVIRNYFNAGLIWAHNLPGFFKQWYEDFTAIIESELRPFGYQSREGNDFRCLDQVALAVTASRYAEHLMVLPLSYNYPLPFRPIMKNRNRHPAFEALVHIHYHKWFQHPGFLNHVTSEADKQSEQYRWLKAHLPLSPTVDDKFKC